MPGVCAVLGSSWSPGITLTPCSFQSICSCRSLISIALSVLRLVLIWWPKSERGAPGRRRSARRAVATAGRAVRVLGEADRVKPRAQRVIYQQAAVEAVAELEQ